LAAVLAALAAMPWWLGLALHPILWAKGIVFERYERVGYAQFRLHHVRYETARVLVSVDSLQTATPVVWLAQRFGEQPVVTANNWSLTILPSSPAAAESLSPAPALGMPWLLALLRRVDHGLVRWLPRAQLDQGLVHGVGPDWSIAHVTWQKNTLVLQGVLTAHGAYDVTLEPGGIGPFVLTAHAIGSDAQLHLTWTGEEFKGTATWWNQPAQITAVYPAQGWTPTEASVTAANWVLPAARVKLAAPYASVLGDARLVWHDGAFDLTASARAQPAKDNPAPPFSAHAAAHGTFREFTLTAFDVEAPFATANLTAPVTFGFDHPLAAEAAQLRVTADLAKLPWGNGQIHGTLKGTVTVTGNSAAPRQTFALDCDAVTLPGFTLQAAHVAGNLQWPRLELTTLQVQLDKTSHLEAHGLIDWQQRTLSGAALQASFTSAALARWLPAGLSWDIAVLSATAEGPFDAPRHQGTLQLTGLHSPQVQPMQLDATWQGAGSLAQTFSARVTANHSALEFAGRLEPHSLLLDKLELTYAGQKIWQLVARPHLKWSPFWQLDSLQLTGPVSQLTLQGPGGSDGTFTIALDHFKSAWLDDWLTRSDPPWQVQTLRASGHVQDDVLVFDTALTAQIGQPNQSAQIKLTAHGDAAGVRLQELTVSSADRVLTQATGRLPVSWWLQPRLHLQLDETGPLELSASTDPDSPLWTTLSANTHLTLTHPTARVSLKGTLRQPEGEVHVQVSKLGFAGKNGRCSLPDATDLVLDLQFGRELVKLTGFSAQLDGQAVSVRGQIPMNDDAWRKLWQQPAAFDWSEAEGQLAIPDADLAPLAKRAPEFMAALGRLQVQVELARGGKWTGELRVTNAATRPQPPFGTLQEINADLTLADHTLTVKSLSATLGGEPVTLTGSITLAPGAAPRIALDLKGEHLPLVRNSGLLVRSDLDLHATTNRAGVTQLTGNVTLRDSLVLANLNSLLPSGPRSVSRQPPYFSVQSEPFRHWPLDVNVRGREAVRVRTTVFSGTLSTQFHLGGTLGEPRAVGEVAVDQGLVLFPFATFKVQQGTLRLSEADPFHARVNLLGTASRRDYQLRIEVTGQLPEPVITLSSTPALDSTDVMLMVMTGRPPTGETSVASSTQRLALFGAYLGRGVFDELGFGGEDRLEVSSGQRISRQGQETYEVEYKLNNRWSLVGEYDELDSYNAGVKWRIYTQESAPREKK
jgi:translocation and assembly module TamB